jgi:hypothetical protein
MRPCLADNLRVLIMKRSRLLTRPLRAALPVALLLAFALPARAQIVYPRLALPGEINGMGRPYLDAAGNLNLPLIDAVSRYDVVNLDVSPITPYHPEIIAALRARNPRITMLGYLLGNDIWPAEDADSLVHFPTRYNHLVRNLDGYLYNLQGGPYQTIRVNIAKRDSNGRFIVAEAVADLFYDAVVSTGLWDGLFVDVFCDDIGWSQTPAESIDVQRAGYADAASFEAAWRAGGDTLASRLRRKCGPDFILVGNCGSGTKYETFNGWTRENFPFQQGGTWYENMFRTTGGYFADEALFRAPTCNQIFTPTSGTNPYEPNTTRRMRFALGSAALGTGVAILGDENRRILDPPFDTWWFDEYAVDLTTGRASDRRADTGWLGTASGAWYQMIWAGSGLDAVTDADFESSVTDGWGFWAAASVAATVTRDATAAAKGSASARIHVPNAGVADWYVAFGTLGTLTMRAGWSYSATFWAKASKPRRITVSAAVPGTSYAQSSLDVGTAWRQYQVILIPRVVCTAHLQFSLAADDGDVWLDDVHFQEGATNLYRRDFQNGIVLVNPAVQSLTVPLETAFRKILGTTDPVVNDGSRVTEVTVPPSDALFLIGRDTIPPAAPSDLRIVH